MNARPEVWIYRVVAGDTLSAIAARNNVPLAQLRKENPQIEGDLVHPEQKVCIPQRSNAGAHGARHKHSRP